MSSFAIYLIGTIIVTGGLALAAYKLNAPPIWIVIGVIIIIGMGVMVGVSKTKLKDKSETDK
jgi:Na+-driven multidrug efflux pump